MRYGHHAERVHRAVEPAAPEGCIAPIQFDFYCFFSTMTTHNYIETLHAINHDAIPFKIVAALQNTTEAPPLCSTKQEPP